MNNEIKGALNVNLVTDEDYYKLRNAMLVRQRALKDLIIIDQDIIELLNIIFEKDINHSANSYIDNQGKRCQV